MTKTTETSLLLLLAALLAVALFANCAANIPTATPTSSPKATFTPTPQPTTTLSLPTPAVTSQAADDIVPAPGLGPAYRGNVQQQGTVNPWQLIQSTEIELTDGANRAKVTYRNLIDTKAGQTRNNIYRVYLPNLAPSAGTLPAMKVRLKGVGLPPGISATEGDEWHGPGPALYSVRILKIGISEDVDVGVYVIRISVEIDGVEYGTVPSEIRVLE